MASKKKSKKSRAVREKKASLPQASLDISDNMDNEESSFIAESYNSNNTKTEEKEETSDQNGIDLTTQEPDHDQSDPQTDTRDSDQLEKEIKKLQLMNQKLKNENQSLRSKLELARGGTNKVDEKSEIKPTSITALEKRIKALEDKMENKSLQKHFDSKLGNNSEIISKPEKRELDNEASAAPPTKQILSRKVKRQVIREINIQQSNRSLENGQTLIANQLFYVHSHLHIPGDLSTGNFDLGSTNYGIHVVVKESASDKKIIEKDLAEEVVSGVIDYKNSLTLPGLNPGKYTLNFFAIVPFIRTSEQKKLSLVVK